MRFGSMIDMAAKKLGSLEPKAVWSIFEEITKIPRCSGKEQKVQDWLRRWAEENHVKFKKDEVGNVLLTREASPGCEGYPGLVLQSHQDMVCEKDEASPHNFDTDPIPVKVEGDIVRADRTTLGADNGMGIAISMALIADPTLKKHGKIEALMTVEEETGLKGAMNMKQGFFTAKNMINLDSEEVGVIIIGSAGGGGTQYTIPISFEPVEGWAGMKVKVDGLLGGHSGVDIHLPRANANKLLGDFLYTLGKETPLSISNIQGGTRGNAIPRSGSCVFVVPKKNASKVKAVFDKWGKKAKKGFPVEENMVFTLEEAKTEKAVSEEKTASIIGILKEVHHGPFSWSKSIEGLVETSNNLAIVNTEEAAVKISIMSRTSDAEDMAKNRKILKEIGVKYGADVVQPPGGTGWKADVTSPWLHFVASIYEQVLGGKPVVTAIHAGLECAQFINLEPGLRVVSVGPTIKSPHSPQELVQIDSVKTVWSAVRAVAEKMGKEYR
jgi:dipeptidase D